jgi:glycosyltransferase involved in cell wall biosynthesis
MTTQNGRSITRVGSLTTSYPRYPGDPAGSFVARLSETLCDQHAVSLEVIAPHRACSSHPGLSVQPLKLGRSPTLTYGAGAPDNLFGAGRRPLTRLRAFSEIPALVAEMAWHTSRDQRQWHALISHWLLPCGLIASRCSSLPHLAIAHGSDVHLLSRLPGAGALLRQVLRPQTQLVLTSASLRRPLLSLLRESPRLQQLVERAPVIRMGVELPSLAADGNQNRQAAIRVQRRLALRADTPIVLYLGRLIELKGVRYLIAALKDLPAIQLLIAGEGPEREALERFSADARCQVRFLGEVRGKDKWDLLCAADVFVLPSVIDSRGRQDSSPVALLEAMAAACPVIGTDVGGIGELIYHDHTGLLVAQGDPEALRCAVNRLLSQPQLAAHLRERGLALARANAWPAVAAQIYQELDQLLARRTAD